MADQTEECQKLIRKIQNFIFSRRPRVKEFFTDNDPLHSGLISFPRFARCVHSIGVPELVEAEIEYLARRFEKPNGDIDYMAFVKEVDEVFGPSNLEKTPMREVQVPGSTVPPLFTPNPVDDEVKLHAIMHRIALLTKTRGVVFKYCFQDFDRSDSTSLTVPRRSGKVTRGQFRRFFPFLQEFSEEEFRLIEQRYEDGPGIINYQAIHDAVTDPPKKSASEEVPRSDLILRPDGLSWTQDDITAVERVQARIVERRIRPRDYFKDFDPLRKGYLTVEKARSVFSILNLDVSERDFATLCNLYCRPQDKMFHYDAFQNKVDEAFTQKGLEMEPLARPIMPTPESTLAARKNYIRLDDEMLRFCAATEAKVRIRVAELRMPLADTFKDFDRERQGHITASQFGRVLATLGLGLTELEIECVAKKYCDRGNTRDVNYVDFSQVIDPVADYTMEALWQSQRTYQPHSKSVYFDKNGEVVPVN